MHLHACGGHLLRYHLHVIVFMKLQLPCLCIQRGRKRREGGRGEREEEERGRKRREGGRGESEGEERGRERREGGRGEREGEERGRERGRGEGEGGREKDGGKKRERKQKEMGVITVVVMCVWVGDRGAIINALE